MKLFHGLVRQIQTIEINNKMDFNQDEEDLMALNLVVFSLLPL